MADWHGMARSNYFHVKDADEFRTWANELDLTVITDSNGRVGFYSNTDDGGFPSARVTDDPDQKADVDLDAELAAHLAEGSIAILVEVGFERACYASGYARALNHEGQEVSIVLSDIYTKAAEFFKVALNTIPEAKY